MRAREEHEGMIRPRLDSDGGSDGVVDESDEEDVLLGENDAPNKRNLFLSFFFTVVFLVWCLKIKQLQHLKETVILLYKSLTI